MPTPEANTSRSSPSHSPPISEALRNANITESATAETDSFKAKADVSIIMTQDQCLDNGHQTTTTAAISNENSSSSSPPPSPSDTDKVSDDLKNSINSVVSNGVNNIGVQEFNVDQHSSTTDLAIVQNRTDLVGDLVDTYSPSTSEVSSSSLSLPHQPSSENLTQTNQTISSDNQINNIDANKSEYSKSDTGADMTVIKHQNSGENIRDIIATSEKSIPTDSKLSDNIVNRDVINNHNSRKTGSRRSRKLVRSENVQDGENDPPEDPIQRLNKLRESITRTLREVKGVLKQYSTEQSCDGSIDLSGTSTSTPETTAPSTTTSDEGPVRFRFVRKIRRRSVFSEDDETEIPTITETTEVTPIVENKVVEDIPNDIQESLTSDNQKEEIQILPKTDEDQQNVIQPSTVKSPLIVTEKNESDKITPNEVETKIQILPKIEEYQQNVIQLSTGKSPIVTETKESDKITPNELETSAKADVADPTSETPKTKTLKTTKKVLKKDRRASIAAVEINQISDDQSVIPLDLKTQRRPSDSGTLVKQTTTRVKVKTSTSDKTKVNSNRKVKHGSVLKSEKAETIASPTIDDKQSAPIEETAKIESVTETVIVENQTKLVATAAVVQPTENKSESPVKVELIEVPKVTDALLKVEEAPEHLLQDIPIIKPAVVTIDTVKSTAIRSEIDKSDLPVSVIQGEKSLGISDAKASDTVPEPVEDSTLKAPELMQTSSELADSHKPAAETTAPPVDLDQTTEVEDPELDINKMIADSKSNKKPAMQIPNPLQIEQPIPSQFTLKMHLATPKYGTPIQQTAKPKASKTVKKQNTTTSTEKTTAKASKPATPSDAKRKLSTEAEPDEPLPANVPKDALAVKFNLPGQQSVDELHRLEEQQHDKENSPIDTSDAGAIVQKKKRKAKRKVVIRRIKRKLSKDGTFLNTPEGAAELEIEEKDIEEQGQSEEEPQEEVPKKPKSCLKLRQFEIGDTVMYAEHYKKTQVRWKKAVVAERITSISYKLNIDGEERPAHISYIKKFTDRKVNFGGKEYLEIDYAQIEEEEEKERNYSIWNHV